MTRAKELKEDGPQKRGRAGQERGKFYSRFFGKGLVCWLSHSSPGPACRLLIFYCRQEAPEAEVGTLPKLSS